MTAFPGRLVCPPLLSLLFGGVGGSRMTLDDAFETAMVYAMNTYAREVLLPAGLLAPHAMAAIGSEAVLREKYAIARGEARKWAALVVDKGLRPAAEQRHAEPGSVSSRGES
jgi:hypothetical protein